MYLDKIFTKGLIILTKEQIKAFEKMSEKEKEIYLMRLIIDEKKGVNNNGL